MKSVKEFRQLFDEFLESKGVKDEWYTRAEYTQEGVLDAIWYEEPKNWIYCAFIWGQEAVPEGRKDGDDVLFWRNINDSWKKLVMDVEYERVSD